MPRSPSARSSSVSAVDNKAEADGASSTTDSTDLVGSFGSLQERIAHLQWRKTCNERQIQGTLRQTKQLQERDEFRRLASNGNGSSSNKDRIEWVHQIVQSEFQKPLPVTPQFLEFLKQQDADLEKAKDAALARHMAQIKQIQSKLDNREAHVIRKQEFDKKKKELFAK